MKFTKEEISLCKQVAEKYRKKTSLGDWLCRADDNALHFVSYEDAPWYQKSKDYIPLWTISDCLEFFKERELRYYIVTDNHSTTITIFNPKTDSIITQQSVENSKDSLGIACLKAVLAVLEELDIDLT